MRVEDSKERDGILFLGKEKDEVLEFRVLIRGIQKVQSKGKITWGRRESKSEKCKSHSIIT